jgi:hypothetical protein
LLQFHFALTHDFLTFGHCNTLQAAKRLRQGLISTAYARLLMH